MMWESGFFVGSTAIRKYSPMAKMRTVSTSKNLHCSLSFYFNGGSKFAQSMLNEFIAIIIIATIMFSSENIQEHILYDKIYQYLWIKSETSNTVIIIHSMPIYWYYTDKETGEIKKKARKNITKDNIKTAWLAKRRKRNSDNLDLNYPPEKLNMSGQIQIIYLDAEGFSQFLDGTYQLPFAILQRFIEPADDRNSQIQAFWSKSVTLFTKRVCKKQFTNKSMDIYESHCTFEGPEYFSDATQVKDFQSQRISEQIDKMIRHLDAISYGKLNITQGTFYFKVDKKARCWFLFCGNLKFEDDKSLKNLPKELYTQSLIKIPKTVDNLMSVYSSRPLQLNKQNKCIRCSQIEKAVNFIEVPYYYLIDFKEKPTPPEQWPTEIRKQAKQVKTTNINNPTAFLNNVTQVPITFQKIHEKLNAQNYEQLKQNQGFKHKVIQVCMDCYFELASHQEKLTKQCVAAKINPSMLSSAQKPKQHLQRSQRSFFKQNQKISQLLRPTSQENNFRQINNKLSEQLVRITKNGTVAQYVKQRMSDQATVTPQKYSIEQPSTADYLSRKTKSTYLDMQTNSTKPLKNSREQYNQSLQEKLKSKPTEGQ